mmetsp:Transcript_9341/g.17927  ORF Transcript_9341/g.17927 Transcript_9341/m.17927 type:complete len:605 (+) Transcript_9341:2012-3826(+)
MSEAVLGSMDLQQATMKRILDDLLGHVISISPNQLAVLVLDEQTIRSVTNIVSVYELTGNGVAVVEKLESERQPMPGLDVLYLISPTDEAVDWIIRDYAGRPKYHNAHLSFTSRAPQGLLGRIANSEIVTVIKSCLEVNLDYRLYSPEVFDLRQTNVYPLLFSPKDRFTVSTVLEVMASRLAQVCSVLHELPYIAYASNSPLAKLLASGLDEQLELIYRSVHNYPIVENRATLVILDRRSDLTTPLMHDITYESILHDLFEVKEGNWVHYQVSTSGGTSEHKEAQLNYKDDIWQDFRHQPINSAGNILPDRLRTFQATHRHVIEAGQGRVSNVNDIAKAVSSLPEYERRMNLFSKHIELVNTLMRIFLEGNYSKATFIEQMLATGVDSGETVRDGNYITERLEAEIENYPDELKVRLVMIAATKVELSESIRRSLYSRIAARDLDYLTTLGTLGVKVQGKSSSCKLRVSPQVTKEAKRKLSETQSQFGYYSAPIEDIIIKASEDKLDLTEFAFLKGLPPRYEGIGPDTTSVVNFRKKNDGGTKPRLIVFVIGGLSYSEIHYVKSVNSQVILGGSTLMNPKEFLRELQAMSSKGAGVDDLQLDLS